MALSIDLKGKTVLITGGVSGIGMGAAIMYAKAGAKVIACAELDTSHPLVNDFYEQIQLWTEDVYYYTTDVTKNSDINELANTIDVVHGQLDILISNAGQNVFETVEHCEDSSWDFNHKLNLESHWKVAKAMKPLLTRSREGVVIVMTSNHAFSSMKGCFPYNVAKAALLSLVKAMAIEWGPDIRTVGIAPGFIDTPGNQKWFDSFEDPDEIRASTIERHPVKRLGSITEIGGWCVFLSSEYAAFASGTTYLIDGGRSALMQD